MSAESFDFELDLKEVPVTLSRGGVKKNYTLRELNGAGRDRYTSLVAGNAKIVDGKVESVGFEGIQTGLLAISLFDENDQLVSKEDIEKYPSSVVKKLYDKAREISGLDDEKDKVKNESASSGAGSN